LGGDTGLSSITTEGTQSVITVAAETVITVVTAAGYVGTSVQQEPERHAMVPLHVVESTAAG
jgi:hypothetical protein